MTNQQVQQQIANTILNQFSKRGTGGHQKLQYGCGCKQFVMLENGIRFNLPRNKSKYNRIEVRLNSMDTYDIRFYKLQKFEIVKEEKYEGYYSDMLNPLFERITGLIVDIF